MLTFLRIFLKPFMYTYTKVCTVFGCAISMIIFGPRVKGRCGSLYPIVFEGTTTCKDNEQKKEIEAILLLLQVQE
jgi:hypothetical protein